MHTRLLFLCLLPGLLLAQPDSGFRAAATVVDVTPKVLPVIANGSMTSRTVNQVKTPLNARALALAEGDTTVVMLVVDSCMMPRPLLDEVKQRATKSTGIPTDQIMISATHTHSAGSCMGLLGAPADPNYTLYLKDRLVAAIESVVTNMQPAKVGFGRVQAPEFTAVRRWILRPGNVQDDPFGNPTVRANMHVARNLDDVTGPSGPEDPELSLISVTALDDKPLAVLANFSMHYYAGEQGISADYFGLFSDGLKQRLDPEGDFVGIMSHGCSGDIWRKDYARPETWDKLATIDLYATGLVDRAIDALKTVDHSATSGLAMAEQRMTLNYRVPDRQLLEWSQSVVAEMGDRLPKTRPEIYAAEQLILHERQQTEVVTQAIRIGDIAMATTPNETYALTGLKIKAHSPLADTMVISLANGGDGYIPPPEQHRLGGYNTWAARSAGLEVMAEPKISESCLQLLERVTGKPRRSTRQSRGPAAIRLTGPRLLTWYRLDEFGGPRAEAGGPNAVDGTYEDGIVFGLPGPPGFCQPGEVNRCAMFAGGRLHTGWAPDLSPHDGSLLLSLWCWNGMPDKARGVGGWLVSIGHDHGLGPRSLHLGVGGSDGHAGRLILQRGADDDQRAAGKTKIPRWTWSHVALHIQPGSIRAYLNGKPELEMKGVHASTSSQHLFFGGRSDNQDNWEGRLDEIGIFAGGAGTAAKIERLSRSGK